MAGLLGDTLTDPQTLAVLQLAGGLLSPGSLGQGLSRGMQGYQQSLMNTQDMAAKKQAMDLQNIQMQQQKRMFDLQTPFLEEALRRMQEQSAPAAGPSAASAALGQGAQAGSVGPTMDNAQRMASMPQQQPTQGGGSLFPGLSDNAAFAAIGTGGFAKIPDAILKAAEPTEFMKTLTAAGIDPRSAQGQALIQANIAKTNYVAPVNARPGAILRDPLTMKPVAFNPHVPEGGTPVFDASGNVTAFNPITGATGIMQAAEAAKAAGKAQYTPYAGFDANGNPSPVRSVTSVLGGGGGAPAGAGSNVVTPAAQLQAMREALPLKIAERDSMPPGATRDALDREIKRDQNAMLRGQPFSASMPDKGGVFATPPLGAATGADFQQTDLGKRYSQLRDQAAQAQTTTSYLENIKELAKTASTGQFSDKAKFVNSLLATAGVSERADNAVTANNLLDKYGNQIVARLGQGGLGTDAARSILQSAYPNAHMTTKAINEAADNLIGANEMVKAKMSLLSPHGNAKDPVAYQQKEQAFDQAADPRLWQLKGMNAQQAQSYLLTMPQSVRADLARRAQVLKDLGAL